MSLRLDAHGPINREQIQELELQTLKNYEAAKNYYTQKKIYFLQAGLRKNLQNNQTALNNLSISIGNSIDDIVQKQWQPIYNEIVQAAGNPNLAQANSFKMQYSKLTNVPHNIKQALMKGQLSNQNLYAVLGVEYEHFLADAIGKLGGEVARTGVQKCLQDFVHSGKTSMAQAGRAGSVSIMSDLSKNVINNPNANLSISIDIDQANANNNLLAYEDVINYLTNGMFGVQVKLYSMSDSGRAFTGASEIKNTINRIFNDVQHNHTWNIRYAQSQILQTISRFLIDLISPINIAFIDSNGLLWVDDFLDNHMFSMTLEAIGNYVYPNENTLTEIHPIVTSNEVVVRKYAVQKAINYVQAGMPIDIVSSGSAYATALPNQYTISTYLKRNPLRT